MGKTKTSPRKKSSTQTKMANDTAKKHGGIKSTSSSAAGKQYNYGDGTGYWVETPKTSKAPKAQSRAKKK